MELFGPKYNVEVSQSVCLCLSVCRCKMSVSVSVSVFVSVSMIVFLSDSVSVWFKGFLEQIYEYFIILLKYNLASSI